MVKQKIFVLMSISVITFCSFLSLVLIAAEKSPDFDKVLELQGVVFRVTSANSGSLNQLTIVPSGLLMRNEIMTQEIDGIVTGVEIADLNADDSPEIYVYVNSVGSGSYGQLIAYATNKRKSLSEIYLAPLDKNQIKKFGYRGHDKFSVTENRLIRQFPVYEKNDVNAKHTGGTRQIQYKLTRGEASWILKLDKEIQF